MLQALLAGLLTAGMMTSIVVLNEVAAPERALGRLTPVVVGSLDLDSSPGEATFAIANMAPGDVAVRALTITNGGTLPFRYAMRSRVEADGGTLAAQLRVAVRAAMDGACDDERGDVISARTRPAEVAFGSPAWGRQDGDRRLEAGADEVLCFVVALPLAATNDVSGASAALTFTFDAEEIRAE